MTAPWTTHDGLAIYRVGAGAPIFLMPGPHRFTRPGLPTTDALIDGFVGVGREVITFDPPGSGRSTRPARLGMEEMLDCADEALDICGVGGAAPGALWNRNHPHFWRLATLGVLLIVWPRLGPEQWLNNFIHRESFVDARLADVTAIRAGDWLRPREGRTDWHRVARRLNYASRLAQIAVPTLILCGRHDPQYPPTCSEELARSITGAQLIFFERSGHFPFIEEPEPFWSSVATFMSKEH